MKHNLKITALLLGTFLLAQFIGLLVLHQYIDPVKSMEAGQTIFKELPLGERPQMKEETSFIPVMIAVLIGTALIFLLLKFNLQWIWKIWFLLAVVVALATAFGAFIPLLYAVIFSAILSVWKIFKPNFVVQTFTELFIYGGLAAIFVPVFNLWSIIILLILIAIYDAYAVWKSQHMVVLAKSQAKAKIFAGLIIPYREKICKGLKKGRVPPQKIRTAILGGGDIGFPLLFAGVVLKEMGLWQSLVIPLFAMAGLAFLLWWGQEKKFYPAMPFIGAGCLLGLLLVKLVEMLV